MKNVQFQPARTLAVSFLLAILAGGVLLSLPFSAAPGAGSVSFIDALFTSTSAVCVTGLIVKDTPKDYSAAGQAIILALIQLGGLGIMTFSTIIILVAGRTISLRDRFLIQSSFHPGIPDDFRRLVRSIFIYTGGIEFAGFLFLFFFFLKDAAWPRALALSVFHAVSAFCNAGFSLFSDNLAGYRDHIGVNVTIMLLIILGGLGFPVLREVRRILKGFFNGRGYRVSLHSKIVLLLTVCLIFFPAALFFIRESHFSLQAAPFQGKVLASFFQVVTSRTAGYNTIDLTAMSIASVLLLILLMFIGASPASTGGGVKTSTLGVILAFLRSQVQARDSVGAFRRTLPAEVVIKAFVLIALAVALVFCATFLVLWFQPGLSLREVAFEVVSAFGTVGLSLGITPKLTTAGKIIIIATMYIGRIGPLTFLYAFSKSRSKGRFAYAEESVLIG